MPFQILIKVFGLNPSHVISFKFDIPFEYIKKSIEEER